MKLMRVLSLAAVGAGLVLAAPAQRAQALSLINPGAAAVQQGSRPATTEVRWHYRHRYHHHWRHHRWHRWHHHRHWR